MKPAKGLSNLKWINIKNPIKIGGFGFIEFTTKAPEAIINIFTRLGFVVTGRHHSKNILLLEQGEAKFIVNAEVGTDASSFESIHGSGVCGIGFKVADSNFAIQETVDRGAEAIVCNDYELPAIKGIGGSKIYLIDPQTTENFFASYFETTGERPLAKPQITCIDHITHNVFRGNMESWAKFYERIFNFQEIRYFDIKGKKTGLRSKALVSPCGKIRIPLNESQDEHSQIAEFLKKYNGEGIQHIALGCHDIYSVVDDIKHQEIAFQDTPETYYDLIPKRIPDHQENITALKKLRILIDGDSQKNGTLLQIFTKEMIGPVFFEFIERKGNEGFGEGNFQALFESIELDQIRRGVLSSTESFTILSPEELENYANPSLAKVSFGGEETGIGTIEFPKEHSLFEFLNKFSLTQRSAVSLCLFGILLHKYTTQEQFKLSQYQIGKEIYKLDLTSNITDKSCFSELLTSALKLQDDGFNNQSNLVDGKQNTNISYSLAYFTEGISHEYIENITQNHLAQSEMCWLLDGKNHGYLAYNRALFDTNFIANLLRHFDILIQNINGNYDRNLEFLSLTSQTDNTLQLDRWLTPQSDRGNLPIHSHFEHYAQKFPEFIAINFGERQVSYSELNAQANQLAHYLIHQNVQPQDCVGVFVEPGVEILITILAIHKINAVYVPIDTEYPLGRIETVVEQVSPSIIIAKSDRLSEIDNNFKVKTINLAAINLAKFERSNLNYSCSPDSISHIFFTSGTTGTPKGVVSSHRNLIHYIFAAQEQYNFSAEDSFLSATRYTFSISLLMLLLPLVCGGQVNIITLEQLLEPQLLAKAIEKSTFFHLGPSILKILLDFLEEENHNSDRFGHVKHASSGGDMIPADILNRLNHVFTQAEVYAIYGSSEISCMGCTYLVQKELEIEQTLVGKPFNNVKLRVLDQHQKVVPIGVKGEIYFSGQGITQGYLNLPYRTETSYVELDGKRFYRTGDIGRLTPQGNLQILGRDDNQTQIRGMRIELGEIESSLNLHPAISACVVIVKEDQLGEKQLVAYSIPQKEAPNSKELRSFLQETLPQYMIPAHFVFVKKFPLNPNGKVDRRALSLLELTLDIQPLTQPHTATEKQLVEIWGEVLKLEAVGIEDNFFDLGGHSLLATQIISRVQEILEVEISIADLFTHPTIAELAKQVDTTGSKNPAAPILPKPRQEKIPLSLTQQRLWFLYQLEPESSAYNIPLALEIKGVLQINALERAIAEVVRRHEILRTNFELIDNNPLQLISPTRDIPLKVVDLRSLSESEGTAELQRLMETEINRPFDLSLEALLRTTLFQQTPETQVLLVIMHHIVSDGWSLEIFTRELSAIYTAVANEQPSPLPELAIQYADFAHWQREYLQEEIYETQLNYWQQQLAGLPPLLELPLDKPRPAIQTFDGGTERFNLSAELSAKLQTISKESRATLFMTLLASFATLLSRYSNSQDIAIGSPIANRNRSEVEPLMGFFVNTLVLRTDLEEEPSFKELLQQVRQTTLDAYAHSDLQFDQVVEILQPERSSSYNPLFQVMFVLQNETVATQETSTLSINPLAVDQITAQFDLTLSMEETAEGLTGFWQYNSHLFAAETIKRLADNFLVLLEQIVAYPEKSVTALPLLTTAERHQVLVEFNPQEEQYSEDCCIHQLFEEQVKLNPHHVAVVFEEQQLTYQELNNRANQLAHYLQKQGVQPEQMVGICVERSLDTVIGILGILKAGGAYVPLDPTYPSERIAYNIHDSQVAVLLTHEKHLAKLPEYQARIVCLDRDRQAIADCSLKNLQSQVKATNLAYVIYTSGSTGKPKGVLVPHLNIVRLFTATQDWYNFDCNDVWTLFHSYAFDFSAWELWGALIYGGKLVVVPYLVSRSADTFYQLLENERVTVLNQTPSAFLQLIQVEESANITPKLNLRYVIFGGEALQLQSLRPWFKRHGDREPQLVNMYGITETTVHVTYRPINMSDLARSSSVIGCRIPDLQIYLLNRHLQPVPIGVAGEMYVAGAGLARGYLNREDLTKERFIDNPFDDDPQSKLYKSGDLARYLPNGELEYLGRIDHQVKIRGFRIELGEVESVLAQHPDIRETVVIAREDIPGDKRLVAYVVSQQEQLHSSDLRSFLKELLPNYMLPSAFVFLDSMPLTPNGKVNRRAFPAPDNTRQESSGTFVAPQDKLEYHLIKIWEQVLSIQPIGVQDNFFDLGGNSLKAIQLFQEINTKFNQDLSVATLFRASTVEQLAKFLRKSEESECWNSLVPLKPSGSRPPLFLIHPCNGEVLLYRILAQHLGPEQPVYGLQALGLDGKQTPHNRVEDMAAYYIKEIQTIQPSGPYFLGGKQIGGLVAFEMARQLVESGEVVKLVMILDTNMRSRTFRDSVARHLNNLLIIGASYALTSVKSRMGVEINEIKFRFRMFKALAHKSLNQKSNQIQTKKTPSQNLNGFFIRDCIGQAIRNYRPQVYSGRGVILIPLNSIEYVGGVDSQTKMGWSKFFAEKLEMHFVSGDHHSAFKEPEIQVLAEKMRACLAASVASRQ